jgi:hypothetical protein
VCGGQGRGDLFGDVERVAEAELLAADSIAQRLAADVRTLLSYRRLRPFAALAAADFSPVL